MHVCTAQRLAWAEIVPFQSIVHVVEWDSAGCRKQFLGIAGRPMDLTGMPENNACCQVEDGLYVHHLSRVQAHLGSQLA